MVRARQAAAAGVLDRVGVAVGPGVPVVALVRVAVLREGAGKRERGGEAHP